jgi:hypothetical protein
MRYYNIIDNISYHTSIYNIHMKFFLNNIQVIIKYTQKTNKQTRSKLKQSHKKKEIK